DLQALLAQVSASAEPKGFEFVERVLLKPKAALQRGIWLRGSFCPAFAVSLAVVVGDCLRKRNRGREQEKVHDCGGAAEHRARPCAIAGDHGEDTRSQCWRPTSCGHGRGLGC